jgi:hypothetical protein
MCMVTYLTAQQDGTGEAAKPVVDSRDVTTVAPVAVAVVLEIAETWLGWDGRPIYRDGNAWTPHKALRRVGDHLLDHLAEIECRLADQATIPDHWHGRMVTLNSDFAHFTELDLDESTSRLTRLAACYQARLVGLDADVLDARPTSDVWTIREVVHHVGHVTEYAEMIGLLPAGTATNPWETWTRVIIP